MLFLLFCLTKVLFCNLCSEFCNKFSSPYIITYHFYPCILSLFHSDSISVPMHSLATHNTITKPIQLPTVFDRSSPRLWFLQLTFPLFNSHYEVTTTPTVQAISILSTQLCRFKCFTLFVQFYYEWVGTALPTHCRYFWTASQR